MGYTKIEVVVLVTASTDLGTREDGRSPLPAMRDEHN
jgi:hypothetical protein